MRSVVIIYHQNIEEIYAKEWIDEAVSSVHGQTYQDFEIYELNYGGDDYRLFDGKFFSIEMKNHIEAMNFLITMAFEDGADVVFNTNLDDISLPERFEKQIAAIKRGYQLVSCNFTYFGEENRLMNMTGCGDIGRNFRREHNVICHPAVCYHSSFWDQKYNESLVGYEDFDLWKRQYAKRKKFFILDDYLLLYRIHSGQITKKFDKHGKEKCKPVDHRH